VVDVVWQDRKQEVLDEIEDIYKEAGGEGKPSAEEHFRLRTTAAKNVHSRLDDEEKREIRRKIENISEQVNPPDIQKRWVGL
jgi:hypothetical protein